ncbi:MAG: hypothetical protein AMJ46_08890 [Latescibacteria bacterium DG_63]|nr:MAG: hypothetical protein AMJ46_08890 [Latescibacteria bacterium DG_63]
MSSFRRFKAKAILLALVLLLAGHFLVLQRTENSTEEFLRARGDSVEYFRMAEGSGPAPTPFKYRPLVPLLVSLMPLEADTGFLLVSYSALFLCFLLLYHMLDRFGFEQWTALSGLLVLFFSQATLYQFHNPFLTDAAGFLFLFLVFYSAAERKVLLFATAATAGLLCREATLFVVPAYLHTRQFRAFVIVLLILLAVFLLPRILFQAPDTAEGYFAAYFRCAGELGRLEQPLTYFKNVFFTWDFVWLSALLGLVVVGKERLPFFLLALLFLGTGAFLSGLVATDVSRMFSLLAPPLVCLSAACLGRVRGRSTFLWFAVLVFLAWRAIFSVPTVINPSAYTLAGSLTGRKLVLGLSLLLFFLCALVLRKDLKEGWGDWRELLGLGRS